MTDRLMNGEKLERGQSLTSRNGAYTLTLQDDRNLVLYGYDGPAWSSDTQTDVPPQAPQAAEAPEPEVVPAAAEEVPAAAPPPPPPPPPPPAARTHMVVSGDTLWAISERFYGDGSKYQVIADASGISNPDLIHPGQVLTIP
jgi:nucleoid-associated protein YgaU